MKLDRQPVKDADFPRSCGVYVLIDAISAKQPLYVGVAATQTIEQRWRRQHLRSRAGGSALRRSLGVHLGLVERKLNIKADGRFYPADVETAVSEFLSSCEIAFVVADSPEAAIAAERQFIEALRPRLNVKYARTPARVRHAHQMLIPDDTHHALFRRALQAADVPEETAVLFRIDAAAPEGEAEIAYLAPPDPDPTRMNYAAMRAVGEARLYEYRGIHRFLAFVQIDEAPEGAIATELCHEAQHARQFNLYGPKFVELDRILRDLIRPNDAVRYEDIPTERDANAAARAFALEHYADDFPAMAGDERFRQYTVELARPDDLLAQTVAMIWQHAERDDIDARTGRSLGEVVDELADAASAWNDEVAAGADRRVQRGADQPGVVEVANDSDQS